MTAKAIIKDKQGKPYKFFGVRVHIEGAGYYYLGQNGELIKAPFLWLLEKATKIQRQWGGVIMSEEAIDELT